MNSTLLKLTKRVVLITCGTLFCLGHAIAAPLIGAYVWGGMLDGGHGVDRFQRSVGFLLDHGFEAVRFTVTPPSIKQYGIDDLCSNDRRDGCYLRAMLDGKVFDDARLKLVMVTLHDFASQPDHMLDPDFIAAHRDAIRAETSDALEVLAKRFAGRNVQVIVSNWEGDNMIYCGQVYAFARDRKAADQCLAKIGGEAGLVHRLEGFASWIALRESAINDIQRKYTNLAIEQAPEFVVFNLTGSPQWQCTTLCKAGLTVLAKFTQGQKLPMCSYSAYDSLKAGTLDADLDRIGQICSKVVLGEVGFRQRDGDNSNPPSDYAKLERAVADHAGTLTAMIYWNAFESADSTDKGFGLYRGDGSPRNVRALPSALAPKGSKPSS